MDSTNTSSIDSAHDYLSKRWPKRATVGIVLGTGAGQVAERIEVDQTIDYGEIPNFPQSTALGHAGQLILGELGGVPVVAMQGRFHLYEGYGLDHVALPLRVMKQLGIQALLITNASGGINPHFESGDVMAIESHIDLMNLTGQRFGSSRFAPRPARRIDATYDRDLIAGAVQRGRSRDFDVRRGVYVGMLGPNYETRAEYRFLRRVGGDVVGMSTVPEVAVAASLSLPVLGLSVVTNVANPDSLLPTSGQEVIDAAHRAEPKLAELIVDATNVIANR